MNPFLTSSDEKMFEFFVQIKLDKTHCNLFPFDYDLKEKMLETLHNYCFPFPPESNELLSYEATKCINYFKDPLQNDAFYFVYMLYDFQNQTDKTNNELIVYCIISKFLYPQCFFAILQNFFENPKSDILSFYYNAKLTKTPFDTIIEDKSDDIPIYEGFSNETQIAYFQHFFLSHFPTDYIPLLITFLFYNKPIIVLSSSFNILTHTVLAIASFFYPLNIMSLKICPLLPFNKIDIDEKGPQILGIPNAMLKMKCDRIEKNFILFNADESYLSDDFFNIPNDAITEIDRLSKNLYELCKYTRPAFPAPFVLKRIQAFISFITKFIFKQSINSSYEEVLEEYKKRNKKKNEENHQLIDLLLNESENNSLIRSAFWNDVDGEIIKFNGPCSISIRKVPIPSKTPRGNSDHKKKGRKNKK